MHLSKLKFRHPVPDVFTPKKFNYNSQHGKEIQESADSQVTFAYFYVTDALE